MIKNKSTPPKKSNSASSDPKSTPPDNFRSSKLSVFLASTAVLANLATWLVLYLRLTPAEFPIPLHYTIYFGIDYVDNWSQAYYLPLTGLIIIIINVIISIFIFPYGRVLSYLLLGSALLGQVILLIGALCLINLQQTF